MRKSKMIRTGVLALILACAGAAALVRSLQPSFLYTMTSTEETAASHDL